MCHRNLSLAASCPIAAQWHQRRKTPEAVGGLTPLQALLVSALALVARTASCRAFRPMAFWPGPMPPQPSSSPSTPTPPRAGRTLVGRGAGINPVNRFEKLHIVADPTATPEELGFDPDDPPPPLATQFFDDASETILAYNDSPDVPFSYGINPYRGCEHGCAYCYARAYHDYLGWSSGIDFETKIMVKRKAPELLRRELSSPKWQPQTIALSGATDCYQPAERHFRLTRQCLEVLLELRNPVSIITKNYLVTRDLDLLRQFVPWNGTAVALTMTTLDAQLSGQLEPRASRPEARLRAIRELSRAGIPVTVMIAPVIPGLTEHEVPGILEAAAAAGASSAGYLILRLPHSVKDVFIHWLDTHAPGKKDRVLARVREMRDGQLNSPEWVKRFKGEGIYAEQINQLFKATRRRLGLDQPRPDLSTAHFRRPGGEQLTLL
jgi:DNA repair photolyase